jgi:hypothetical protein
MQSARNRAGRRIASPLVIHMLPMSKSNDLPMAYRSSVAKPLPVKYQKTEHFRFNIEATHLLGVENLEPVQ